MPTCCVQREIMFIRPMPVLAVQDRPVNCWSSLFLVKLVVALVVKLVGALVGAWGTCWLVGATK